MNLEKNLSEKVFKIFVDFDGTITRTDIGEAMFKKFGVEETVNKIINEYLKENISARDCWISLCYSANVPGKKSLNDFIDGIKIDGTFHNFVNFCEENKFEFYILSDGFDFYIDRILEREKLTDIKYYSNKLLFTKDNKLIPTFPYFDVNCKTSANCKRNHIINHSSDDEYTVFIGDGNSDKYTVQFCDFIFAKDALLKFCESERITYFPFNNFDDVISKMKFLSSKRKLKKRHQAELKRREVYTKE
jgi:2-hydroxy-3-keto-5-methylthiopentenyl-1-phosphate phosphatase